MHKLYKTITKDNDEVGLSDTEDEDDDTENVKVVEKSDSKQINEEEEWIEVKRRKGNNRRQGKISNPNSMGSRNNPEINVNANKKEVPKAKKTPSKNHKRNCDGGKQCPDTDERPGNENNNLISGVRKQDKPCHFWNNNNGMCSYGENCMFQHIASDYCENDGHCKVRFCPNYHEKQSFLARSQMKRFPPIMTPPAFFPPNFYHPRNWPPLGRWPNPRMF